MSIARLLLYLWRLFKIPLILIGSSALFLSVERLCHKATDGFSLVRMTHPLPKEGEFQPPKLSLEEKDLLLHILNQPFHYLGCGGQTYVFASEDGHYVMKFLKFHHRRIPFWVQALSLPKKWDLYRQEKMQRKAFRLIRTLRSYVIAYDYFKQETGMIYHHLIDTQDLKHSITFFDTLGYRYILDADHCAFILQKRGLSTDYVINQLMKEGKIQEAQDKISELIAFSIKRCQKGLKDRDFKFKSNLGFIDNQASQIDLGSLSLDNKYSEPRFYKAEISHAAKKFRTWLKKEHPSLLEHFDKEIEKLYAN
jgi:hypothetical protein